MKKYLSDLTVKHVQKVNATCVLLVMTDDKPIPACKPGQFVELRIDDTQGIILRRPISIHYFDVDKNEIGFLIQVVGEGTKKLSELKKGDKVNVILPLGNGFGIDDDKSKKLLLVGGGVGSAPLFYLGMELKKAGYNFTFLIGARKKEDLYRREEFESIGRVEYTTEDASIGEKGFVTNHSVLNERYDKIYTCGPKPMMMAIAEYAKRNNIECEVSLENKMACGLGACLCCVEDTKEGHRCVCVDGPVFSIDELKW